jgi:hypothetical protein
MVEVVAEAALAFLKVRQKLEMVAQVVVVVGRLKDLAEMVVLAAVVAVVITLPVAEQGCLAGKEEQTLCQMRVTVV